MQNLLLRPNKAIVFYNSDQEQLVLEHKIVNGQIREGKYPSKHSIDHFIEVINQYKGKDHNIVYIKKSHEFELLYAYNKNKSVAMAFIFRTDKAYPIQNGLSIAHSKYLILRNENTIIAYAIIDDNAHELLLPNMYDNHSFCTGNYEFGVYTHWEDYMKDTINFVFHTKFNKFNSGRKEKLFRENKMFVHLVPLKPYRNIVDEFISETYQ